MLSDLSDLSRRGPGASSLDVLLSRDHVEEALTVLRKSMWSETKGTWWSMRLRVTNAGECKFDFDYEERPGFNTDLNDHDWVTDLAAFPRPEAAVPSWHPSSPDFSN